MKGNKIRRGVAVLLLAALLTLTLAACDAPAPTPAESSVPAESSAPESSAPESSEPDEPATDPVGDLWVVENGEEYHTVVDSTGRVILPSIHGYVRIIRDEITGEPRLICVSRPADKSYGVETDYGMEYLYEFAYYDAAGRLLSDFAVETQTFTYQCLCGDLAITHNPDDRGLFGHNNLLRVSTGEVLAENASYAGHIGSRMLVEREETNVFHIELWDPDGTLVRTWEPNDTVQALTAADENGETRDILLVSHQENGHTSCTVTDADGKTLWQEENAWDVRLFGSPTRCFVFQTNGRRILRDALTGETLLTTPYPVQGGGGDLVIAESYGEGRFLMSLDGERLSDAYEYLQYDRGFFVATNSDPDTDGWIYTVFNRDGEKILERSDSGYVTVIGEDRSFLYTDWVDDHSQTQLYDRTGQPLPLGDYDYIDTPWMTSADYSGCPEDYLAGIRLTATGNERIDYLDPDGQPILTDLKRFYGGDGTVFLVNKGFKTGLMDRNGNWLYSEPCYSAADD